MKAKRMLLLCAAPLFLSFIAVTTEPESDLEELGLKGNVKSVTTVSYEATLKFDELVKGKRSDSMIRTFNTPGAELNFSYYASSNYIADHEYENQYNTSGHLTKNSIRRNGSKYSSTENIYDGSGNLIEANQFDHSGNLAFKTKNKYNSKGQLFCKTVYYATGERKERAYYFYDPAGEVAVKAEVNGNGVLQEYKVYVHDELSRLTRVLTYDGCMYLLETQDMLYHGKTDEYTGVYLRTNPVRPILEWEDSVRYDDNGVMHWEGHTLTLDANGLLTESLETSEDVNITDKYENGVLRSSIVTRNDNGSTFTFTYNKYGDVEKTEVVKQNAVQASGTYIYNDQRLLAEVRNPSEFFTATMTYDKSGRLSVVKTFGKNMQLQCTCTIQYTEKGYVESTRMNYADPSKTDRTEEHTMERHYFTSDDPEWWMDGLMHTKLQYVYVRNEDNLIVEESIYNSGYTSQSTFTYKSDAKGNWIYQLETDKETGKPKAITERKIFYR